MDNQDIHTAIRYHQETKHSVISVQTNRHYLDWENQPRVYKIYRGVESLPLPPDLPQTGLPALHSLQYLTEEGTGEAIPDLNRLAYLLFYTGGVTKKLQYPGGEIEFRAAAAAGALYPIEIYAACGDLPGLPAGVYHFEPRDFSMNILRTGDYRDQIARAAGWQGDEAHSPLVLILTAITWRSAWKYQARSYRYHFWDAGTILANCLAACRALGLPARVALGFTDREVDRLAGIDGEFEKSLALIPVGRMGRKPEPGLNATDLKLAVEPLSADWRAYPIIDALHRASALDSPQEVEEWRKRGRTSQSSTGAEPKRPVTQGRRFPLPQVDLTGMSGKSLEETIVKRGSSRRFRREPLQGAALSAILAAAASGFPSDWSGPGSPLLNHIFLNVHSVEGLPPGAYLYLPDTHELNLLQEGDFRGHSAYLCLGQELGGDASATVFFLADLEAILNRYGNRGYRLAQLEAGILGGKMYLAAYALGLGASGLTFFDDDVVNFFSPEAQGLEAIFVTALGIPAHPARRTGKMVYLSPGNR
jgi:SagB-type dehydrogenase family enzyme